MISDVVLVQNLCEKTLSLKVKNELLSQIQDRNWKQIGLALTGRIKVEELTDEQYAKYKNCIKSHRYTTKLLNLYETGVVDKAILLLYGISGDLPSPEEFSLLDSNERREFLTNRYSLRLGIHWDQYIDFPKNKDWMHYGF